MIPKKQNLYKIKINKHLLNFFVTCNIAGYFLFVSASGLIISQSTDSQRFTVLYRILMALFSILLLFKYGKSKLIIPNELKSYLIFFLFFLIRATYDIYINPIFQISTIETNRFFSYTFLIILLPAITFLFIVEKLDFDKILYQTLFFLSISIFLSYLNLDEVQNNERLELTNGLGVITTGHLATMQLCLSFFSIKMRMIKNKIFLTFIIITSLIALRVLFLSGSRGPFLNLVIILVLLNLRFSALKYVFLLGIILFFYSASILISLAETVPIFANRVLNTGGIGGRYFLYMEALEKIRDNLFFGSQFALERNNGGYVYSHNLFLDAVLSLGVVGFALIITSIRKIMISVLKHIKSLNNHSWVAILLTVELMKLMASSSFYQNERFLLLMILLYSATHNIKNESIHPRTKTS